MALYVGEKFVEYVIVEIIDGIVKRVISSSGNYISQLIGSPVYPEGIFLRGSSGGSGGGSGSGGFRVKPVE